MSHVLIVQLTYSLHYSIPYTNIIIFTEKHKPNPVNMKICTFVTKQLFTTIGDNSVELLC
jgi:hypothetical protein